MHNLSIHKTLLFNLLKKNKFVNSKFFVENCHPEINELIQKEIKRNLKCPLSIKNSQQKLVTQNVSVLKSVPTSVLNSVYIFDVISKRIHNFIF
jgi:hypothetical protein